MIQSGGYRLTINACVREWYIYNNHRKRLSPNRNSKCCFR